MHVRIRRANTGRRGSATLVAVGFAFTVASGALLASGAGASTAVTITTGSCAGGGSSYCYTPESASGASGTTFTWTNNSSDGAGHTVTRCTVSVCGVSGGTGSDSGPASGTLAQGQSYTLSFSGAGTYVYYCAIHGYAAMHATITVAAAATPPASTPSSGVSAASASAKSVPGTGANSQRGGVVADVPAGLLAVGAAAVFGALLAYGRSRRAKKL